MSTDPTKADFRSHLNIPSLLELKSEAEETETLMRQPLVSHFTAPMGPTEFDLTAEANKIYRFIVGKDQGLPKPMEDKETEESLQDSFANLVLKKGKFPTTADGVVAAFRDTESEEAGLENLRSFVVAEGGQINWDGTTQAINRTARLVLLMEIKRGIGPDVMISTGTKTNSETQFLQLMSWDSKKGAYNFYQRMRVFWIYSGHSFHALEEGTRGKGPFSGHVNGGPIMKELRVPWQHWHSQSATIKANAFHPDDPLVSSPYFTNKDGAEAFELMVRSGVNHWNQSRIDRALSQEIIMHPNQLIRQILESKNVNLISSPDESRSTSPFGNIRIPFSFFANFESLESLGIDIGGIGPILSVQRGTYGQILKEFNFSLQSNGVSIPGETHFAFFIPEVAEEDINLLKKLLTNQIISKRLAACLLMVDYPNPIYSKKRAALQVYIPDSVQYGAAGKDLDQKFLERIEASTHHTDPSTPEGEFFSYWSLGENEWKSHFSQLILNYMGNVRQQIATPEGFKGLMFLAESRREIFRRTPQFEFSLTFASNTIPKDQFPMEMMPTGEIRAQQ